MFWGATIKQDKPYLFPKDRIGKIVHISNASLGENVDAKKVSIYLESNKTRLKICTLIKDKKDCSDLDNYLKVTHDSKIIIKDCPKGEIHITGYLEREIDESPLEETVKPVVNETKQATIEGKKQKVGKLPEVTPKDEEDIEEEEEEVEEEDLEEDDLMEDEEELDDEEDEEEDELQGEEDDESNDDELKQKMSKIITKEKTSQKPTNQKISAPNNNNNFNKKNNAPNNGSNNSPFQKSFDNSNNSNFNKKPQGGQGWKGNNGGNKNNKFNKNNKQNFNKNKGKFNGKKKY